MAKSAFIEGFFPEVKGNPYFTGRGRGSTTRVAIARAFGDLLKKVSGKRIGSIKATIIISDVIEEEWQ
jgi:hypothetical protein